MFNYPSKEVNGYKVIWNDFWETFQCIFDGVILAEFNTEEEAIKYCEYSKP